MAILQTYAEVQKLKPNTAEKDLINKCQTGEPCILGDGTCPSEPSDTRTIRADILRYLLLGGCKDCVVDGRGVVLVGGYISGTLDIDYATVNGATHLIQCHFENRFDSIQTHFKAVTLDGSDMRGWLAQGAKIDGSVLLRNTTASATVILNSATIGGQLNCSGAQLTAKEGNALYAQGAKIEGSVFLVNTNTSATVNLNSATIGGQLSLNGATFDAGDGYAFWAQRLHVVEGLIWRGVTVSSGRVNLNAAHVGDLVDDPDAWPDRDNLSLDGFTYDSIYGVLDVDARLEWVKRGSYDGGEFYPQPFTQLAKVLRDVGHDGDAQKVLTRREHLRLRHQREQKRIVPNGDVSVAFKSLYRDAWIFTLWVMHQIFRRVAGYGHRPFRSLWAMLVLFLVTAAPAELAWREGSMAPNSGPVLVSDGWLALASDPTQVNPADAWGNSAPGKDWESFSAIAYGLDVVIPIINFGQTDAWAPSTERQWWGQFLYWW